MSSSKPSPADHWLIGGGEMGRQIRSMDWSKSPLGPIHSWPQSLRTTVSLCLSSNFPISIAWGPRLTQIYNDGYWPICGEKHPRAMGQDFRECWASAFPVIGEAFNRALAGTTSFLEDQRMFLDRLGYPEETFFTFSFSPIRDESGGVGGLFHPVTETTGKMLAQRRTRALRDLASRAGNAQTIGEALSLAARTLSEFEFDLPFVLLYALNAEATSATLVAHTGLPPGTPACPLLVDFTQDDSPWPLAEVARCRRMVQLDDLRSRFSPFTCGPYPEPPKTAFVFPVLPPGFEQPAAFLVAGVSSRSPINETYRGFFDLIAAGVTTAVANAHAHDEKRKRAEALAEIDRAKTEFFSNVSHEFRTPLTLMLGPLEDELAERAEALPGHRRERIEVAHRNSLRLLKLVNSLLDFSRVEAGRAQATFTPTDLASCTAELAAMFESAAAKAGLTFTVDCPRLPEPIYVDRDMWEKIVLNLLSNAFKHTFEGGITVSLRWNADHAELSVTDTGVGISAADQSRLFERFQRVQGAKSRTHEGSGIGLALVRELATLHGGTVAVQSQEGKGTTFTVRMKAGFAHLPREMIAKERGEATRAGATAATAYVAEVLHWLPGADGREEGATSSEEGTRPRILLADDSADMREYVRRILARDYEVTAVPDGAAALAAARANPPALIVSDVMMPVLDGFGLLRAIRADARTKAIPLILLSARAGEESSVEGLGAGADDYVCKPFSARELLARVHAQIELSRTRGAFAEELERRVQERTAELNALGSQLLQSQKMEVVGRLAAGIAHDFNNLLTAINGYSELLLDRTDVRDPTHGDLQEIHKAGERAAALTRQLLAFSRKQVLQPRVLNLNAAVGDIERLLRRVIGENVVLTATLADDAGNVRIDPTQLEQVIVNLAVNGRDAMPRGGRLVIETANVELDGGYVHLHPDVAAGAYVMLSVTDTGSGMTPEVLSHLFEPFFTTKEAGKGTGLGLATVHGIVKQSGGGVLAYSEPGRGTTFKVYLPRVDVPATPRDETSVRQAIVSGSETLLLAEDDAQVRALAKAVQGRAGYIVHEASSGEDALAVAERHAGVIDLLISDVVMPGLPEEGLAALLRRRRPDVRVMYMSGYSDAALLRGAAISASTPFLSKPFTAEGLLRMVRKALSGE